MSAKTNNTISSSTLLYDALRSNQTPQVLSELFASTEAETDDFFTLLSKVYQQLKLKRIPLSQKTQFLIETKLIELQFIYNTSEDQKDNFKTSFEDIKDHLHFLSELIHSFLTKYFKKNFDINTEFIFHAQYITQHLAVLKRRVEYSYNVLPWEEMQFCLAVYLNSLINPEKTDTTYKLIINKDKILAYLQNFHLTLNAIITEFKEEDLRRDKVFNRNFLIQSVLKKIPIFGNLYEDFTLLKNFYSLEKISYYINRSLTIDIEANTTVAQLVIERTLQVMGEYLKNSPDSPNLSDDLYKSLLKSAPRNLKKILTNLRNMLSHSFSLNRKLELESSKNPEFFKNIQNDFQKIHIDIVYMIYKQKIEAVRLFLKRLLNAQDVKDVKLIFKQTGIEQISEVGDFTINPKEFLEVKKLVILFCEKVAEDSNEDDKVIAEVLHLLAAYETKINNLSVTYVDAINKTLNLIRSHENLDIIKSTVRTYLSMLSAAEPQSLFDDIFLQLRHIHENVKVRRRVDPENYLDPDETSLEIGKILTEIYNYLKWRLRKIKWLKEMEDELVFSEETSVKHHHAQEIFQMVVDKLESEEDKILVTKSIEKLQQKHFIKYELMDMLDAETQDFQEKIISLGLGSKHQKDILYNHERKKFSKLILMLKRIDDHYGTFLRNLPDMFPVSRFLQSIKEFYSSCKLKKSLQSKIDEALAKAINEKVIECYRKRLHTLELSLANIKDIQSIRENDDLVISLEMLVLDLMEFLKNVNLLGDNKMLLVNDLPILVGTQLRNYLAHGDLLMDILPYNPINAIIYHANRLLEFGEIVLNQNNVLLGYQPKNPNFSFKQYFKESLNVVGVQTDLLNFAKNLNVKGIQELIKLGGDILGTDYNGWTVMHFAMNGHNRHYLEYLIKLFGSPKNVDYYELLKIAVTLGNMESIQFLIKEMHLDIKHYDGLLNVALEHNQEQIGIFLIQNGATLDKRGPNGKSSLHFAAESGCLQIVKWLINENSNTIIDSVTDDNLTSLHLAAQNGYLEIVKLLLNKNANANIQCKKSFTALQIATIHGHLDILQYFLKYPTIYVPEKDLAKAVHLAAEYGQWHIIETMIDKLENEQINSIFLTASLYGHKHILIELLFVYNDFDIHCKDSTGKTALHLSSQCGHYEVVELLLEKQLDPNICDVDGWTAIHWACHNNHIAVAQLLLFNKSNVNAEDRQGKTALHLLAQNGNLDGLNVLLSHKANPNALTANNQTALHLAATKGCCEVINKLINSCNVDINAVDNNCETALMLAADNGHTDALALLLHHKADPNLKNKEGISAITRAATQGYLDIIIRLIKHNADIEIQEYAGWRPLNWAVQNGYIDIVDELLKYGVDVKAKFRHGGTALHTAIRNGHIDIVKKLIKHGSDVNAMMLKILPLRVAAHFGHKDIVLILLANGAKVDATGSDMVTPLHAASWNGHLDIVDILLQNNADVNSKTEEDWTALHFAAKFGFLYVVRVLLKNGANIYLENNFGCTVLHTACEMGQKDIVEMLLNDYKVDINIKTFKGATGLHWAAANAQTDVLDVLIRNNADVNIKATDGSTPLHWAADNSNSIATIRKLIRNGAELNIKDTKSATPLHLAVIKGNENVVLELLTSNADVNVKGNNIYPLHLAVTKGYKEITKMLLERGAIVDGITIRRKTCLHMAIQKDYKDIAKILLSYGAGTHFQDENGMTALHWGVQNGYKNIISLLINNHNINIRDNRGRTALHIALEYQNQFIAILLIENGTDIHIRTLDDYTYLHLACQQGMNKVVSILLKYGADVKATCKFNGSTPLYESLAKGNDVIANTLIENNSDLNAALISGWTALHLAAGKGIRHIVHLLITKGANVNAETVDAETPLFFASLQGHFEIVKELLDNGANVNIKTLTKQLTALSVAAQEGHVQVLKTLILHGAEIDSKQYQGLTALHIAALYGHKKCIETLLENRADINVVSNDGRSVLHMSAAEGHVEIVKILLENGIDVVDNRNAQGDTAIDLAIKQEHHEIVATIYYYIEPKDS